ncbi:uncharacterized protein LOC132697001 [Cylas formicarius]|uniref:uncharacterized protein LOC132697001 n=1 Tax=Cylas formicarius TaxID=197179 RepID=UPI0029587C6E|nr:uncharacterized protein LOC132697001 [Cylas formicarius]
MDSDALALQVNILFFLNSLKASGVYQPWIERVFEFNTNTTLGTLDINNPIGNTEILDYDMSSIVQVTKDVDGNFNACIYSLPVDYFNVDMEYVADIGINNAIPIYGSGDITMDIKNIELSMCWILTNDKDYINDIDIDIVFRHGPMSLSGFFNNHLLDQPISNVLTTAYRFFAMWASYEPTCSKCVLNPLVKFLANYIIYRVEDDKLEVDCTCAKEILVDLKKHLLATEEITKDTISNYITTMILEYI